MKARAVIAAFNAVCAVIFAVNDETLLALVFAFFAGVMACTVLEEFMERVDGGLD
jgi:zinc transporter ZupT